jgi:hypothetical protein
MNWVEGPALWEGVTTLGENGKTTVVHLRPDAWFTLQEQGTTELESTFRAMMEPAWLRGVSRDRVRSPHN